MMITYAQSTFEMFGSIHCGSCQNRISYAVNKLVLPSVVKYRKVSPAKSKGQSKLKLGLISYFIHSHEKDGLPLEKGAEGDVLMKGRMSYTVAKCLPPSMAGV